MKILIPILGFGRAGGYRVLSELATHWVAGGHQVDFLVNQADSTPYFPTKANIIKYAALGKTSKETLRGSKKYRIPMNLLNLTMALLKVGKQYDVILVNHFLTSYPVALVNCGVSHKYYYIQAYEPEYCADERGLKNRVFEWLAKKSYALNLDQICNAKVYVGYKEIKAKVAIPPGIDTKKFYPKNKCQDLATANEIVIGCIGRTEPSKGIRYLIEAFNILHKEDPKFKLKVAFANLPSSQINDGVHIVVPNNDKELGDFYRSIDILVAPGIGQLGAPHYPVMEAMACKTIVITTGYLPADDNNSLIIPEHDSKAIVEAVKKVVSMPSNQLKMKVELAFDDMQPFNWKSIAADFIDYFEKR